MARNVVKAPSLDERIANAVSQALALRGRKSKTPVIPADEAEHDRVARVLRMQKGMRGQILRHVIRKGPGVFTYEGIHAVEGLDWISPANVAACLTHIAWKMQGGEGSGAVEPCGYTLAVDGTGVNVRAMLSRVKAPAKKAQPRKAKALPAPAPKTDENAA
jgi:hypothetical protein